MAKFLYSGPDKVYEKFVHFGDTSPNTYIDHGDSERRRLFYARTNHFPDDPKTPATLSRGLLWNTKSLKKNLDDYREHYGL